jgi:hypothetical protein
MVLDESLNPHDWILRQSALTQDNILSSMLTRQSQLLQKITKLVSSSNLKRVCPGRVICWQLECFRCSHILDCNLAVLVYIFLFQQFLECFLDID